MNEDFHSQAWVDNRAQMSSGLADLARDILFVFQRLTALQYASPWLVERCRRRGGQRANVEVYSARCK